MTHEPPQTSAGGYEVTRTVEHDPSVPHVELQQKQMQYLPKATMVVIDDVGHSLFGENPAKALAPVRAYLRKRDLETTV